MNIEAAYRLKIAHFALTRGDHHNQNERLIMVAGTSGA